MYAEDSFYTLSTAGRIGLVVLSIGLSLATAYVTFRATRSSPLPIRLTVAGIAFWTFIWLSPQIYYLYYLVLFDGLPIQIVIRHPPSALQVFQLLTFTGDAKLSAHGQGGLAWLLVIVACWPRKRASGIEKIRVRTPHDCR